MFDIKEIGMVPPPYGGVSVYISRLIEMLSSDGFSVGGYYTRECKNVSVVFKKGFDKWSWFETSKYPYKIFKYIYQLRNYKIIHSHLGLEAMIYMWSIKTLLRKKLIITIHNSMISNYVEQTNKINLYFLKKMLNSDVVWITVSEEGKQQMYDLPYTIKNTIHVIPAYIPYLKDDQGTLCNELQNYINTHEAIIVFYGHSFMLNSGKDVYGFKTVLAVFDKLIKNNPMVGLILCLADTKDSKNINDLHSYANQLGIDENIFWQMGAINNMQTLWKQTHVYFRPTSTDGDSVAVREAVDAGVRVVASDVVKRPETVFTYKYNIIEDAVVKIQDAIALGRMSVSTNFSNYQEMKSIYDKLL